MSYYENRYTGPSSPSVVEMEQRVGEVSPRGSTVKDVADYEEAPPPYYTKPFPNGNRTAGEAESTTTTGGNTWAPTPNKTPAGADPEDPDAGCECDDECQECCGPFLCMILIMGVIGLIIWAIVEASDGGGGGGYRGG